IFGNVVANGPADQAGIEKGDRVLEVAGRSVATWQEFVDIVERSPGVALPLVIDRDGEQVAATLTPENNELESGLSVGRMQVMPPDLSSYLPRVRQNPLRALAYGAQETWTVTALT